MQTRSQVEIIKDFHLFRATTQKKLTQEFLDREIQYTDRFLK